MGKADRTRRQTIEHLLSQLDAGGLGADVVRVRPMFGEYGLYCHDRFVGVVCRDRLYIKPTEAGDTLEPDLEREPPYEGAKPSLLVSEEISSDAARLAALVRKTADSLPQ